MPVSAIPTAVRPEYYFDLDLLGFADLFADDPFVWGGVTKLQCSDYVDRLARAACAGAACAATTAPEVQGKVEVCVAPGAVVGPRVVVVGDGGLVCIDDGAEVLPGTVITAGMNAVYIGPRAWIGPNAHLDAVRGSIVVCREAAVRQGAYVRERSVIGPKAIIGNSCEIKCSLIGPEAQVPHFNYVGDSLLGFRAHTGAGVKLSNLKITLDPDKPETIKVRCDGQVFDTGLHKFGAVLGDGAQLGCNTVANPGTLVGKNSLVYSLCSIAGVIPANTVVKLRQPMEHGQLRKA